MSRRGFYKFDKDAETIEVRVVDLDAEQIGELSKWLRRVQRYLHEKQVQREGGRRWDFERPVEGEAKARRMNGKVQCSNLTLIPTFVRKARLCHACAGPIERECWRQKPGSWGGHARVRFCGRCVEGTTATFPALRLVESDERALP